MQPLAVAGRRAQLRDMTQFALLPQRAVVAVDGPDRVAYLQGLVSNDVERVAPGCAVWAALLTPQGKWVADFFILHDGERLLLDVERDQAAMIVQRLGRFRLRSKVALSVLDWHVYAMWGGRDDLPSDAVAAPDSRLPDAGWRVLAPAELPTNAGFAEWDARRLQLGLPDGSRDLETEKSVLLEAGFDELGGVSWSKGCYMGQELTARTKYRGLIKRRLVPVTIQGDRPAPGTPVVRDDGVEVGTMRSGVGDRALATLRLDSLSRPLISGEARVVPQPAAWMQLAGDRD